MFHEQTALKASFPFTYKSSLEVVIFIYFIIFIWYQATERRSAYGSKRFNRISGLLFEILEATNEYPEIWNIIQQLIAEFEDKFDIKFYKF